MKPFTAMVLLSGVLVACSQSSDVVQDSAVRDWAPQIRAANDVLLNQGDLGSIGEFFAASYVSHGRAGSASGHEAISGFLTALRTAFPDLVVETEVLNTADNVVTWLRTSRGTHQGDFMGVSATGQELTWQTMIVTRYEGELIAEEWAVSDLGEVIRSQ